MSHNGGDDGDGGYSDDGRSNGNGEDGCVNDGGGMVVVVVITMVMVVVMVMVMVVEVKY